MKINSKIIILGFVCLLLMIYNPYKIIVVRGESMLPTYKNGQVLIARKTDDIRKGDVVVATNDLQEIIIKRVIYTAGDSFYHYLYSGTDSPEVVFLDDNSYKSVTELLASNKEIMLIENKVPKDHFFIMGDNRNNSDDSRRFGTIERKNIFYKIIR